MKTKIVLGLFFCSFLFQLYQINGVGHSYYSVKLEEKLYNIVLGQSAPRGRILDRNGIVLVDNAGILEIIYHKFSEVTMKEELEIAEKLAYFVSEPNVSLVDKKNYYLAKNANGDHLITEEEWQLLEERKITNDDIKKRKWERITEQNLEYSEEEEKIIQLFNEMQEGYLYQDKLLFSNCSEDFVTKVLELNIESIQVRVTPKRTYPYGETLKTIFGSVGSIPKEELNYFLKENYVMTDLVGISGLEKEYESILKGKKAKYFVNSDNSLTLIEEAQKGEDIILNIDIAVQLELEKILKEELMLARNKKGTEYFRDAYAYVGNPTTGGILAMAGIRLSELGDYQDITITSFTSSYAMGSVVKGASQTVGYLNGAITVGEKIKDSCVKLWSEPSKCSYKYLGYVDDITALKTSSNYYQFITAIKTTGQNYNYNMHFSVTEEDFLKYRNVFASYGLGEKTNIDYPLEQTGMKGSKITGDLLLNLAIGQYDTYTPISLLQYINTIANYGKRYALSIKQKESQLLNKIELDPSYYDRITEGMYQVFHGGTASNYVEARLNAVGKTGTSETFYDSDFDGIVDKEVINSTLIFYYPREKPAYSVAIVAPYITTNPSYSYPFTRNVSQKITKYLPL